MSDQLRSGFRGRQNPGQDGEFLWLVSLSDLMILLFVFFVALFSFSYKKMDRSDFKAIADSLSGKESGKPLDEIQQNLLKWAGEKNLLQSMAVEKSGDAIVVQIKEGILFNSGQWVLKPESRKLVQLISLALKKIPAPYRLGIEGHTDDEPLKNQFRGTGNWELSAKRALEVFKSLDLSPDLRGRTVILSYGPNQPLFANKDESGQPIPEHRLANRRVTLRIF